MIVSWNWLAQYVKLDMPVETLTQRLALTGLNHESTEEIRHSWGTDLAIDLEVTSNRSDCLGHLGVAREIAVVFGRELRRPDPQPPTSGATVESLTSISVEEPGLCPRFTARVVSNARIGSSPWWLQSRLLTLGQTSISNVVDVTNYVMFENGQPLHAYDLDKLAGRCLIVRKARRGETLRAINGKTYELTPDMLVIADAERPVGLAGVMGGLDTEIGPDTRNILIEAAQFDSMSVRRTARALGLHSPSSYRFERPIDPEGTEWASRRCAELILATAGGTLHPGCIDVGERRAEREFIRLRLEQFPRVLGITIGREEVERILTALGLECRGAEDTATALAFRPPSWRNDLDREIDLVEEVARVHGYEHIPEDRAIPLTSATRSPRERVESNVRETLAACGFDEAVTFSLVADELSGALAGASERPPIRVEHSSRKRDGALRQSLVPSLLSAVRYNQSHGNTDVALFEIANVYQPRVDRELPDEPTLLTLVSPRDIFELKGIVESILNRLHIDGQLEVRPASTSWFADGRAAELSLQGERLGYFGELDRSRLDTFDIRGSVTAAELDLNVLIRHAVLVPRFQTLPPYPAVSRDL
ncbi:MAG: phenylalanine--tRNA ligase subunit beta [Isosphaeraceae bacterium]